MEITVTTTSKHAVSAEGRPVTPSIATYEKFNNGCAGLQCTKIMSVK